MWWDGNDTGVLLRAYLGMEVPFILRENDAALNYSNVVDRRVCCASVAEVMLDVFYVEVLVEASIPLPWL
jgi:hypothetical protein